MKYTMNVFGYEDSFGTMEADTLKECEVLAEIELDCDGAVEVFETATNNPVPNYKGKVLGTDSDGFFYRIKG